MWVLAPYVVFIYFCITVIHEVLLYCRYLSKLLDYLSSYLERVHPLLDQAALQMEILHTFREKWVQGSFPGWRVSVINYEQL